MMKVLCVLVVCVALLCFAEVSAQENEEGNQFLNEVKLGNLNRAKTMLQEGKVSANYKRPSDGNTALHIAADASNLEMAKMVLSFGADTEIPNNDNWLPMHIAARENNSEFVHLLFRFNPDASVFALINEELGSPLMVANRLGNTDVLKTLLEYRSAKVPPFVSKDKDFANRINGKKDEM